MAGGEGVQSLARAFLYAGSRAVLATLWPIEDVRSARLMSRFYERLPASTDGAAALASARREMIRAGLPPGVWAAYVWIGDPDIRPVQSSSRGGRGAALMTGLLLAAFAAAGVNVRRGTG